MKQNAVFGPTILADILSCGAAFLATWWMFSTLTGEVSLGTDAVLSAISCALVLGGGYTLGLLYPIAGGYIGFESVLKVGLSAAAFAVVHTLEKFLVLGIAPEFLVRALPVEALLTASFMIGHRAIGYTNLRRFMNGKSKAQVAIYGAGEAGRQLLRALMYDPTVNVKCFLDDDEKLWGRRIGGVKIHAPEHIENLIKFYALTNLVVAMPSMSTARVRCICDAMSQYPLKISKLPHLAKLATGIVNVSDVREVNLEDLLGRDVVAPDQRLMAKNIRGKVVLVTGAGGSIGSELCRQIASLEPEKLILLDNSEFALFAIHAELRTHLGEAGKEMLVPLLRDVTNHTSIQRVFEIWAPSTVFHAAAYKHVSLVEENVCSGLAVNVFGTLNVVSAALRGGAQNFVLISTDKAVRPTNVMGATKRVAELLVQAAQDDPQAFLRCYSNFLASDEESADRQNGSQIGEPTSTTSHSCVMSMVRFGNVLGSSGSVVPIFLKQIAGGGPVKVTHPEVVRYFMTIPEATLLVIQAAAMADGGDVFILDMGEPKKIVDLAKKLIHLAGHTEADELGESGIAIEFTGLRPGEKLYEELLIDREALPTQHARIFRAQEGCLRATDLFEVLDRLEDFLQSGDLPNIYDDLRLLVSGFTGVDDPVDVAWCASTKKVKRDSGQPEECR